MKITSLSFLFLLSFSCGKKSGSGGDPVTPSNSLLSITDVRQDRDPSATTSFHFTVNVDHVSTKEIKVDYTTVDGTATADYYTHQSGTLIIPPNQHNGNIEVQVRGDSLREDDKVFYVQISNPVNATISGTGKGTGTIICQGDYIPIDDEGYNAPDSYPGLTLKWSDEFNGTQLDHTNWNIETGGGGWGNNELQYYTDKVENVYVATGGYLVIEAKKEQFGTNAYTSARVQTLGKQEFTYGRMDIRAKLPKGQGVWPAIWMLGGNIATTPWPACGEIDIMELLGHEPNKIYGTMHWGNVGESSSQMGGNYSLTGEDFTQRFHVFTVIRTADKIEWWVDNVKYYTGEKSAVNGNDPFDNPFFFVLNVAVGGNWPGNPDGATVFPQRMIVDYVRVYE